MISRFPDLVAERSSIADRIAARPAPLKIILKARDERHFLRRWFDHHAAIAGAENLIVIDNGSTDPEVLATLEEIAGTSLVVSFAGFHNRLHYRQEVEWLYEALRASARYYCFLDTDEYLTLIESGVTRGAKDIVPYLLANQQVPVFPGTWLVNRRHSETLFHVAPEELRLGLLWGKPVIRGDVPLTHYLNHNCNLTPLAFSPATPRALFVRHMTRLNGEQRIAANLRKLAARRVIGEGDAADAVIAAHDGSDDPLVALYVREMREAIAARGAEPASTPEPGCVQLREGEALVFGSEADRTRFDAFVADQDGALLAELRIMCQQPQP